MTSIAMIDAIQYRKVYSVAIPVPINVRKRLPMVQSTASEKVKPVVVANVLVAESMSVLREVDGGGGGGGGGKGQSLFAVIVPPDGISGLLILQVCVGVAGVENKVLYIPSR